MSDLQIIFWILWSLILLTQIIGLITSLSVNKRIQKIQDEINVLKTHRIKSSELNVYFSEILTKGRPKETGEDSTDYNIKSN